MLYRVTGYVVANTQTRLNQFTTAVNGRLANKVIYDRPLDWVPETGPFARPLCRWFDFRLSLKADMDDIRTWATSQRNTWRNWGDGEMKFHECDHLEGEVHRCDDPANQVVVSF